MIRIYKDNDIKVVTQGVYNNLYKPLGYKLIIEEKTQPVKVETKIENKELKQSNKESSKSKKIGGK